MNHFFLFRLNTTPVAVISSTLKLLCTSLVERAVPSGSTG